MAKATTTIVQDTLTSADETQLSLQQVENALAAHGDGIVALLDFVDALHQSGLLEMATALLQRGENVLEIIVHQAKKPEAVGAIKNLFALCSVFSQVDLSKFLGMVTEASKAAQSDQAPPVRGVWDLVRALRDPDVQRGLSIGLGVLKGLGQAVGQRGAGGNGSSKA
jgi:uncharacterized protein YjgD (DUF1641 family)